MPDDAHGRRGFTRSRSRNQGHETAGMRTDVVGDLIQQFGRNRRVDGENNQRVLTVVATHLHAADVYARFPQEISDDANDARLVVVAEEGQMIAERYVDIEIVDLHDLADQSRARHRAAYAHG